VGKPSVLLLGSVSHGEFEAGLEWLRQNSQLTIGVSVTTAARWLQSDEGALCRWIVVAQQRPGQFSRHDIERLHRAAPLARLIGLLGGWCEGESRSGAPWPGVIRLYWHQFRWRAEHEWNAARVGQATWSLARTATDADRLLAAPGTAAADHRGMIIIRSLSQIAYECLADVCAEGGWSSIWWPPRRLLQAANAVALVWDAQLIDEQEMADLRGAVAALPHVPVLVATGFPQVQDVQAFQKLGVRHVLSKPFLNEDLLAAVAACRVRLALRAA
jgi:hypothetical protein